MKTTFTKGNGILSVAGYKSKIAISVSFDKGQNWKEIKSIKKYGSKKRVNEIWNKLFNYGKLAEEYIPSIYSMKGID